MNDIFSLTFFIIVSLIIIILTLISFLINHKKIKVILGDIFLGIGVGIFAGTIFAFSIRCQIEMFCIYSLTGLVFLICGAILKNH